MANGFLQSTPTPPEKRTDLLTAAIINSAIDMETTLGTVYAIVYMRRHNIDMELALRVVLKKAERRTAVTWSTSEIDGFSDFEEEIDLTHFKNTVVYTSSASHGRTK